MKIIKKIFTLCFLLGFTVSCETYKDYEIEYTSIYPMCGEWLVRFTDTSITPNITSELIVLSTFNTADNSSTQMWIRAEVGSASYIGRFDGKINCNLTSKSFSGENVSNTYYTTTPLHTFTVTDGLIVIDGYDTATGGKSDKISFTMTDTRKAGKVYSVTGFRRTLWSDDEV